MTKQIHQLPANNKLSRSAAALHYAACGCSVIPVNQDKTPLLKTWKEFQSRIASREEILSWFRRFPVANIAIVTGKISGITVVDIDIKEKIPGLHLPPTLLVGTQRGFHFYYRYHEEVRSLPFPKTDIKNDGGYIVAPPSVHRSGVAYEFLNDDEISDFPIDNLKEPKPITTITPTEAGIFRGVSEGQRNITAAQLTGRLLSLVPKSKEKFAYEILRLWNLKNRPPLPETELMKVFESILGRHIQNKQKDDIKHAPITFEALSNKEFPPEEWLIENLVPLGGITILSGKPASFKTWVVLHFAMKIAGGGQVFEHFPCKKTGVLILDEESGEREIKKRLCMVTDNIQLPIYISSLRNFKVNELAIKSIRAFCQEKNIQAVIIDSLVRIHNGNENDAVAMSSLFEQLKPLMRDDIAVVFTHHNRKKLSYNANEDMRGSSDILAAATCHLSVKKRPNEDILDLEQKKMRIAEEIKPFSVLINKAPERINLSFHGYTPETRTKKNELKTVIKEIISEADYKEKSLSGKEIYEVATERLRCTYSTFKNALRELVEEEAIFGKKSGRNKVIYSTSPLEDG